MAMDAYVQLALIEKAKRVFAADAGIFLSFPLLSPLQFTPQTLAALSSPDTADEYAAAADFARIVNFLPRDMVANGGDRYLWDVYGDVLSRATVAAGSAAEPGQVGASTLLYDVAADGTRSETAAYRTYRQYRDAWFVAREDYGARKLTGELTDKPEATKQWTEVEEPALRSALERAETDFKTLGRRDEIEAALQAERDAARNDPSRRWREWSAGFNPDIDVQTDPANGRYAPTGLSPKDFTSEAAWLHFDLSAAEMASLVHDAPAALKVVLDDDGAGDVDHVSFDYRSVAVVRPWFNSAVLTSRVWRSSDPDLALSDGGNPPAGACPGYVSAVVFIRNLRITSRAAPAAPPARANLNFTIAAQRLTQRAIVASPTMLRKVPPPAIAAAPPAVPPPATAQRAFIRLATQSLTSAPSLAARPAMASFAIRPGILTSPIVRDHRLPTRIFPGRLPPGPIAPPPMAAPPAAPPSPTPIAPPAPVEQHDEIAVLAFICKRLPKTPDAMPELRWV